MPLRHHDPRDRVRPPPGLGAQTAAVRHPPRRALDGPPRRQVIICSHYMRGHVADIYDIEEDAHHGDPERDRPRRPAAGRRPRRAARAVRRARREARAAGRPARLREGLSARARRAAGRDRAGRRACASSSRAPARTRQSCKAQAAELGPDRARHVPGLDRRRRPALALPDRRPVRGALALRAVRPRRAGGDGLAAARASWPTPAACARSCPDERVGLRFNGGDAEHLA